MTALCQEWGNISAGLGSRRKRVCGLIFLLLMMRRLFYIQFWHCGLVFLLFLSACGSSEEKCELLREWKINNFRIVEKRCPDAVLAFHDIYRVYDKDKLTDGNASRLDSCTFTWQADKESFLTLNVCNNTVQEIKPHKIPLDVKSIDSVVVYSNELRRTKLLTRYQIEQFAHDWNSSKIRGYANQPFDSAFAGFLAFQYKLTVFSKGGSRPFYGNNMVVLDSSNWKFEMKNGKPTYFHTFWKNAVDSERYH